ncbi:GNAT family N-acetyltransferase [Subtercola boreus]|uniref:GNAT family N-acetyltransferase n=1 Tax=Subtercola boreus TaxID=120213 RepID=UPI001C0EEE0B|nr:GNAT family N-acetyltransferase [Subtercola boreus]
MTPNGLGDAPSYELRIPSPADAEAWFELFDDPDIMRYIGDGRVQPREWYQAFAARQRVLEAETGLCLFALVRRGPNHDMVAGFVGLQPWTQQWGPTGRIEMGWRLGLAHQGAGLATAAARECLARAAASGIHDPIAMIDVQNRASVAVAQKLGMVVLDEVDAPSGARVAVFGFRSRAEV